jgi:putative hydrolase of the HAD superfamily
MIKTILFDLDDTLYPPQVGIMNEIRVLILRYIETRLNLSSEEADDLRHRYLQAYGTTMRGLQLNHQIDPNDYLEFVHDIPLHEYLSPNPLLDAVLASIPQGKVIFTNASCEHAENVLSLLDIRRHFVRIVDIRDMDYESKPQPTAYRRVCQMLDALPEECVLVEDNPRNLRPAKALGMTTVLVQDGTADTLGQADYVISRVEEIGKVLALLPAST